MDRENIAVVVFLSVWILSFVYFLYKNQSGTISFGGGFLIACISLVVVSVLVPKGGKTEKKLPGPGNAYVDCQFRVKEHLKSPSTASFPTFGFMEHAKETSPQRFEVNSYVDAENSFGAKIRTNWKCKISYNGQSINSLNLWIDGEQQL